jgi:hypothetical protein
VLRAIGSGPSTQGEAGRFPTWRSAATLIHARTRGGALRSAVHTMHPFAEDSNDSVEAKSTMAEEGFKTSA